MAATRKKWAEKMTNIFKGHNVNATVFPSRCGCSGSWCKLKNGFTVTIPNLTKEMVEDLVAVFPTLGEREEAMGDGTD